MIKLVSNAVPEVYIKQFRNIHSNAITSPIADFLSSLLTTYGSADEDYLQRVHNDLLEKVYDTTEPL